MKKHLPLGAVPPILVSLLVAGAVLTATGAEATLPPAPGTKTELRISLKYVPTDAEEVLEKRGVMAVAGPPFEILPVVDDRPEPRDLIGRNIERKKAPVPVWTRQPVGPWLSQVLETSFADWGTPGRPGADLLLEPELVKLFVVEEHTYVAELTMKFTLKRRDGTDIWAGVVGGGATRFGRSLKEGNYQEVVSDAVLSCYSKLWADPGFREAWAGKTVSRDSMAGGGGPRPAPTETLEPEIAVKKLLELRDAGFEDDSLVAWVRKVAFTRPLTADDMLAWKSAGVPQAVIRAAVESE